VLFIDSDGAAIQVANPGVVSVILIPSVGVRTPVCIVTAPDFREVPLCVVSEMVILTVWSVDVGYSTMVGGDAIHSGRSLAVGMPGEAIAICPCQSDCTVFGDIDLIRRAIASLAMVVLVPAVCFLLPLLAVWTADVDSICIAGTIVMDRSGWSFVGV